MQAIETYPKFMNSQTMGNIFVEQNCMLIWLLSVKS